MLRLGAPAFQAVPDQALQGTRQTRQVGEPWPPPVPTGSRPRSRRLGSRRCMPPPYAWTSFRDPPFHLPFAASRATLTGCAVSALGLHVSLGHRPRSCLDAGCYTRTTAWLNSANAGPLPIALLSGSGRARRDRRTESYAVQGVLADTDWITVCGELYTEATYWLRLGLSLSNCPFNTMTACCPFLLEGFLPTFALSLPRAWP